MRAVDILGDNVILQLKELGLAIRLARIRRGLRRETFAQALAMSMSTVRRIESGDTGVAMGAYMAAFNYIHPQSVNTLLGMINNEPGAAVAAARIQPRQPPRVRAAITGAHA